MYGKDVLKMAKAAKRAAMMMGLASSSVKNAALGAMAVSLSEDRGSIVRANRKDVKAAKAAGLSASIMDRLILTDKRIDSMIDSLNAVAALPDPVGTVINEKKRPNGLRIRKVRVPIGTIAIIYEARPNVTSDCIGLCLKSGNAVILKGGREAIHSNTAIFKSLEKAANKSALPENVINLITSTDRKAVSAMLKLDSYIDLVIPRGGEGLIRAVAEQSRIPVIKHYKGVCHTYVDAQADINMAHNIAYNAKVQRPGVCNAMETLLVHSEIAPRFLPVIAHALREAGVEIRGCALTRRIVKGVKAATKKDWSEEYLDLILSVKVVGDADEAIDHINTYGSGHSDAIITEDNDTAQRFVNAVDSSSVYVNASTRFTDGFEFGLGAEIGISTDKIHARGPMGLEELTTYKYAISGTGQIRK